MSINPSKGKSSHKSASTNAYALLANDDDDDDDDDAVASGVSLQVLKTTNSSHQQIMGKHNNRSLTSKK